MKHSDRPVSQVIEKESKSLPRPKWRRIHLALHPGHGHFIPSTLNDRTFFIMEAARVAGAEPEQASVDPPSGRSSISRSGVSSEGSRGRDTRDQNSC